MRLKITKEEKPVVLKMKKDVTIPKAPFKRRKRYFGGVSKRSRKA